MLNRTRIWLFSRFLLLPNVVKVQNVRLCCFENFVFARTREHASRSRVFVCCKEKSQFHRPWTSLWKLLMISVRAQSKVFPKKHVHTGLFNLRKCLTLPSEGYIRRVNAWRAVWWRIAELVSGNRKPWWRHEPRKWNVVPAQTSIDSVLTSEVWNIAITWPSPQT